MATFEVFRGRDDYTDFKYVDWNVVGFGKNYDLLGTDSVSICLAITLYNPLEKKGTLAHIMGTSSSPERVQPENVIDTMLSGLNGPGKLDYQNLEATLSGEGHLGGLECSKVVREKLREYGIPIIGEDLGGGPSRLVYLHCDTGNVEVYRRF